MVAESVEETMRLENALRQVRSERAMVVLHYAPIRETVEGESFNSAARALRLTPVLIGILG